jgi:hypothetical protein
VVAASRLANAQRDHQKERDMNCPPLIGTQIERPTNIKPEKVSEKRSASAGRRVIGHFIGRAGPNP